MANTLLLCTGVMLGIVLLMRDELGLSTRDTLGIIAAITVIAYRHALTGEFVYEDSHWLRTWGDPLAPGLLALVDVPWMVGNWLGSGNPWGYHAVILTVHVVNGLMLFWLAQRLELSDGACLFAAGFFWLHPVNGEAVNYLSAGREVCAMMWLLMGLSALTMPVDAFWRLSGLFIGLVLGLTAKASMAPAVVLVPLAVWPLTHDRRLTRLTVAILGVAVALFSVPALYEVWRQSSSEGSVFLGFQGMGHYAAFTCAALVRYLAMIPVPYGMSVDRDWHAVNAVWPTLAAVAVIGWCVLMVRNVKRVPALAGITFWVLVSIAPRFVIQQEEILNEHQVYFAFLPIWVGLGYLADYLLSVEMNFPFERC